MPFDQLVELTQRAANGDARVAEWLESTSPNAFLRRALPFFVPDTTEGTWFIPEPSANRGIECRAGMRGVVAEVPSPQRRIGAREKVQHL